MGLDMSSYRRAVPVSPEVQTEIDGSEDPRDAAYERDAHLPYFHPDWPERAAPLQEGVAYVGETGPGWSASYGGYLVFRRDLANLVGIADLRAWWREDDATRAATPFFELLDFADNEGVIGSAAAAEISRDFAEWQVRADAFEPPRGNAARAEDGEYFRRRWEELRKVFEWAADGGWVDFH